MERMRIRVLERGITLLYHVDKTYGVFMLGGLMRIELSLVVDNSVGRTVIVIPSNDGWCRKGIDDAPASCVRRKKDIVCVVVQ